MLKIIDGLFFCISFMLIFTKIPKEIQMSFFAGNMGDKLAIYPILIGMLYTIYCHNKYKNIFINFNKIKKYIFIYVCVIISSMILGFYNYPYYELIANGPIEQIDKLPIVLGFFYDVGLSINEDKLMFCWMFIRFVKNSLLEIIYTFFVSYMIYCWYYNRWKKGVSILIKAILMSLSIIFLYNIIEIWYLSGNDIAKNLLVQITPFFHIIAVDHNWWPPLLWNGQMRSIFAEPSNFGIYGAFCIPFLWYTLLNAKKNKIGYIVLIIFFSFSMFLTKARTATALFGEELILLTIFLIYI